MMGDDDDDVVGLTAVAAPERGSDEWLRRLVAESDQVWASRDGVFEASSSSSGYNVSKRIVGAPMRCWREWEKLLEEEDADLLGEIRDGIRIPFVTRPPPSLRVDDAKRGNSPTVTDTPEHRQELKVLVEELEKLKAIEWRDEKPQFVCRLSIAYKSTLDPEGRRKPRLICDLRPLNEHIRRFEFSYETLAKCRHVFEQGDWLLGIDVESAYHHWLIHPDDQGFLGFSVDASVFPDVEGVRSSKIENGRRFGVFRVLPFGASFACFYFTRLLGVVAKHLRLPHNMGGMAARSIWYIDDILLACSSREEGCDLVERILPLFARLGISISFKKSFLIPSQEKMKFLGLLVDTMKMEFSIPPARLQKILAGLVELLAAVEAGQAVSVRALASTVGRIISCFLVLGSMARQRTRSLFVVIAAVTGVDPDLGWKALKRVWDSRLFLGEGARELQAPARGRLPSHEECKAAVQELQFWHRTLPSCTAASISPSVTAQLAVCSSGKVPQSLLKGLTTGSVDTSESASGGFIDIDGDRLEVRVLLRRLEQEESSTARELIGAWRLLQSFVAKLRGKHLALFLDNQSAVRGLHYGSRTPACQRILVKIWDLCVLHGLRISAIWLPRTDEIIAYSDRLGRWQSTGPDFCLDSISFQEIRRASPFSDFTVDAMASPRSRKCHRFFSRYWNPDTEGADAMAQRWDSRDIFFVFPPFPMVGPVIAKLRSEGVQAALVVPMQSSATWSPLLAPTATGVVAGIPLPTAMVKALNQGGRRPFPMTLRCVFLDFTAKHNAPR